MTKFYTTIILTNNNYIGVVYKESNNEEVYRTQEYTSQSQAIRDINTFIKTNNPPPITPPATTPQPTTNFVKPTSTGPIIKGRCCGR
jgi:hypothetical protein